MHQATIVITNPTGIHARPAAVLVQTAGRFQARVYLEGAGKRADARSILQLMNLGVRQGNSVRVYAEGDDAAQALEAVLAVLEGELVV